MIWSVGRIGCEILRGRIVCHSCTTVIAQNAPIVGGQGPIVRLSGQTVRVVVPKMEGSMAVGEAYETKASANGTASAQKNTPDAPVVDLTE